MFLSLFLLQGHSFQWICTKFGMWHPYNIQMVIGGRGLASTTRAGGLMNLAPSIRRCK